MDPKARAFIPKFSGSSFSAEPVSTTEEPTIERAPFPVSVSQSNALNINPVKETWEEQFEPTPSATITEAISPSVDQQLTPKTIQTKENSECDLELSKDPELLKEMERMALEEGRQVDDYLIESMDTDMDGKQSAFSEEEKEDNREHVNVVFIGHVDAGKSTIAGQIMLSTGMVDERTIQKYEKEAKEKNRESWFLAYIMDTNEEERAKGKTVEVGRASFETKTKRYTVLDAPGHKNYVPNMIGGASQADIGILVISARKGEFDAGFNRGGQTREHTILAKTLGIKFLVVLINKMDDPTVGWDKERYNEIISQLSPFIKQVGYNTKTDVIFLPVSGIKGINIKEPVDANVCNWYNGPSLLQLLDDLKPMERLANGPLRIPIISKYRDRGCTVVTGKVESGTVSKGDSVIIMPNKTPAEVLGIMWEVTNVKSARAGENIRLLLRGVEEENVHGGHVICNVKNPIPVPCKFEGQVVILDLPAHKSIFSAGYNAVIHLHSAIEECTILVSERSSIMIPIGKQVRSQGTCPLLLGTDGSVG